MTVHCVIFALLVLLFGCDKPAVETPPPPGETSSVSGMIGPAGGRIGMPGGAFLDIPADAVDSTRMFSISATTEVAPFGAVTPIYRFEPDGIVFAHPVTITLPLAEDAAGNLRIFWSKQKESGFEEIGGSKTGRAISAQVLHFSAGYAAPGTGSRTVSGSQIVTYIAPGRITNVPTDLSRLQPLIYTQTGQWLAGEGFADGTFRVSNVPDGPYLLNIGNDFYVTDSSVFDAGRVSAGRPDATVSTKPTALRFTLTELSAWQAGEKLEAFSAENDTWWFELSNNLTPGTTTLSNFSFDHTQAVTSNGDYGRGFLIDGARGDFLTLAQLSKRTSDNGHSYIAMSKIFTPAPFTQIDGTELSFSGSFADVSMDNTISIDLRVSEFEAAAGYEGSHAVLIHPQADPQNSAFHYPGTTFALLGEPGNTLYGEYSCTADYLILNIAPGGGDTQATNMHYGAPGAGSWTTLGDVRTSYAVAHQLAGTSSPALFFASISRFGPLLEFSQVPVQPTMGPVRNPKINGLTLFQNQTQVGITPTLSWEAPTIGSPTHYAVILSRLFEQSGETHQEKAATIHTTTNSLTIPMNVLMAGQQYVIQITADNQLGVTSPSRIRSSGTSATIISAVIAP